MFFCYSSVSYLCYKPCSESGTKSYFHKKSGSGSGSIPLAQKHVDPDPEHCKNTEKIKKEEGSRL
jgi:hypothetical protein